MEKSDSNYSPKGDLIWLLLRPWIFIPRLLYILLTLLFLLIRIFFQSNRLIVLLDQLQLYLVKK